MDDAITYAHLVIWIWTVALVATLAAWAWPGGPSPGPTRPSPPLRGATEGLGSTAAPAPTGLRESRPPGARLRTADGLAARADETPT